MAGKATTRRARSLRRNASSTERFLWKLAAAGRPSAIGEV
jgi:very-short-patch-repair endonuclease